MLSKVARLPGWSPLRAKETHSTRWSPRGLLRLFSQESFLFFSISHSLRGVDISRVWYRFMLGEVFVFSASLPVPFSVIVPCYIVGFPSQRLRFSLETTGWIKPISYVFACVCMCVVTLTRSFYSNSHPVPPNYPPGTDFFLLQ